MGNTEGNHARTFFALPAMPIRMALTRARTTILTRKTRARMLILPSPQVARIHFLPLSVIQKKPLVQDTPKAPTSAGAFDANSPRLPSGETEKDGQIHSAGHLLAFHPGGFPLGHGFNDTHNLFVEPLIGALDHMHIGYLALLGYHETHKELA